MMDRGAPDRASLRSSVTEEDLEEARQRLLTHQEVPDVMTNGDPPLLFPVPAAPPAPRARGYGSISSSQSTRQPQRPKRVSTKRYRLPFLILLVFEWGLVIFLSIVCWQTDRNDGGFYFSYDIRKTYFDIVTIATARLVIISLFYILMCWVNRFVMAITTIVPALYIPVKAYYSWSIDDSSSALQQLPQLLLLFVAFVVPWLIVFFFEFKYLPAEISRLHIPTWKSWRPWLWPMGFVTEEGEDTPSLPEVVTIPPSLYHPRPSARPYSTAGSSLSLDFRTPVGSSRGSPAPLLTERVAGEDELDPIQEEEQCSSSEMPPAECDQTRLTGDDLRYKQESNFALETLAAHTSTNEGWKLEKRNASGMCYSKQGPKRKIIKGEAIIDLDMDQLWSILYPGDKTSEWSPQCALNEVLHQVDRYTDVVYTVSNAIGPVAARDFVSARQVVYYENTILSASISTLSNLKPELPGRVRGENGPCGYLVEALDSSRTKFVWVIDSNLKGWVPQAVIDQTVCGVLLSSFQNLRKYIEREREAGRIH